MNERSVPKTEIMGIGIAVQLIFLLALLVVNHLVWVAKYLAIGFVLIDVVVLLLNERIHLSTNSLARILFYSLPLILLLGFALIVNYLHSVGKSGP